MKIFNGLLSTFILVCVMTSCSQYQLQTVLPDSAPKEHIIKNVPYVKQMYNYCGPASAEMVLKYYGINNLDQETIGKSNSKGTNVDDLIWFLNWHGKDFGFVANRKIGNLELLKKYISSDIPVIVRQWTKLNSDGIHYRVVVGYNDRDRQIIYHDPNRGSDMMIDYDKFLRLWDVNTQNPKWSSTNLMIIVGKKER